jgi:hypothetical protein
MWLTYKGISVRVVIGQLAALGVVAEKLNQRRFLQTIQDAGFFLTQRVCTNRAATP